MEDLEPKVLEIKYDRGKMNINLDEFMQNQTVSKINKLLKIIRCSYTDDLVDVIAAYCNEFLSRYEGKQKALANLVVQHRTRAKELEPKLEKERYQITLVRKGGENYKSFSEQIKVIKGKIADEMWYVRKHTAEFRRNERLKVKYEKVLEKISQG